MRTRALIVGLLLLVAAPTTALGKDPFAALKQRTLAGLIGVAPSISMNVEAGAGKEFDEQRIKKDVLLEVRKAGIPVFEPDVPGVGLLSVIISAVRINNLKNAYAFSVQVELVQMVSLARDPSLGSVATTWDAAAVGTGDFEFVRRSVRDKVNDFALAYLTVNPKR